MGSGVSQEQHAVFQQLYVERLEVAVRKMGQVDAFEFRAQSAAGWMGFDVVVVIDKSFTHELGACCGWSRWPVLTQTVAPSTCVRA